MEGALEFFQNHFCRSISIDKFNKEYAYNIRYMYGKEGRRIPLQPLPCQVMIKTIPVGNQCYREKNYEVDVRRRSDVVESL